MADTYVLQDKALKQLLKAFKGTLPTAHVGVLGKSKSREGTGPTNAMIGAAHEFGTEVLPMRSFLRVPVMDNLSDYLAKSGAFDKIAIKKVVEEGSISNYISLIGKVAEQIVLEAFNSGGFGKWRPSNMKYKTNWQTLVETHQLRDSITSEVIE